MVVEGHRRDTTGAPTTEVCPGLVDIRVALGEPGFEYRETIASACAAASAGGVTTLAALPRELVRCRFPLSDGGDNPPWLVRLAVESVAAFLRAKVPVLVCCSAGMSRSDWSMTRLWSNARSAASAERRGLSAR